MDYINELIKKEPESVTFIRNEDGTYKVRETGIVGVDENNKLFDIKIVIPKCKVKWDINGFILMPSIEEVLKSDNESGEIYVMSVSCKNQNEELQLCTKVNGNIIPKCMNLREQNYCVNKTCH